MGFHRNKIKHFFMKTQYISGYLPIFRINEVEIEIILFGILNSPKKIIHITNYITQLNDVEVKLL